MSNENESGPIGYKRPPVTTQFKPGRSGNPSGRPKKVRSLKDEVLDELGEVTRIREDGRELEISKARAIAKSLVRAAAGGNMRATTALLTLFAKGSGDITEPQDQMPTSEDNEILDDYIDREARRRANTCDATAYHPPTDLEKQRRT